MSTPVLDVKNIGKAYRNYGNELWRVLYWFGIKRKIPFSETWTLHDISFSVNPGESLGIIGQNGAGKSTLLKIITGTLKPTTGSIATQGKIAAILELGMGFHHELTGRQNAYHSAGLMGYTHEQIESVIDEIESFAEIGEYFDKPVRLYSSGMHVRVAFAVATAFRPEILIVDEALSVGDAYFQHKSFARIKEFKEAGTSLIFVSHDKGSVLALCDRAILLDKGRMIKDGDPEEVTDYYNALISEKEGSTIRQLRGASGKVATISGTGEATIRDVGLYKAGESVEVIDVGDRVELRVSVDIHTAIEGLVVGYMIKDRLGQSIYGTNTHYCKQVLERAEAGDSVVYSFIFDANMGGGSHSISIALHTHDTHLDKNFEWRDQALIFNVVNLSKIPFLGLCWVEPKVEINHIRQNNRSIQ